jgi:hypothetical protein
MIFQVNGDFMPLSAQIAKVRNAPRDIFGLHGLFGAKKNGEREGTEYLNDIIFTGECIAGKWEEYCFCKVGG